jgi:hypothetical protein
MIEKKTVEQLLGFRAPHREKLPDSITEPFYDKVKGKRFGATDAALISRYGFTDYQDHPLQWIHFKEDGKRLHSYCPGPEGSDASVAGPYKLVGFTENGDYLIELQYGCKTTFSLKKEVVKDD